VNNILKYNIEELIKELKLDSLRCSEYRINNGEACVFFYFSPGNLTSTSNSKPNICAFVKEGRELLDFSTAELLIDNEKAAISSTDFGLSSKPTQPLCIGKHSAKILVNSIDGGPLEFGWSFFIEDELEDYVFSYGIPHSHTSFSDGTGTPAEAYERARTNGLNFLIVTDHQGKLVNGKSNYDRSILISGSKHPKWEMLKLEASSINKRYDNFIALCGFELSTKFWGHINIINSESIIERKPYDLKELYEWLCKEEDILLSINHPYRSPRTLPFSHNFDNFVNLYEVGNGSTTRVYNRAEQNYYSALDDGWHIAAINGQDNHSDDWGDSSNVTAVVCSELTPGALIDGIKLRRVYSTESRTLKLIVKFNNFWMGSILNLKSDDIIRAHILAEDLENPIEKLHLISNGGKILVEKDFNNKKCEWNFDLNINSEYSWYVVKVIHSDGKIAISSAIFVQNLDFLK
jgi:hypothetical protein